MIRFSASLAVSCLALGVSVAGIEAAAAVESASTKFLTVCGINGADGDVKCIHMPPGDGYTSDQIRRGGEASPDIFIWGADPSSFIAAQSPSPPARCDDLAKTMQALKEAHVKTTILNPGQVHFIEGAYVTSRFTPPGLPPGDGAVLLQRAEGDYGIMWTKGKTACLPLVVIGQTENGQPKGSYISMPISADAAKILLSVGTAKGEILEAPSAQSSGKPGDPDELKL